MLAPATLLLALSAGLSTTLAFGISCADAIAVKKKAQNINVKALNAIGFFIKDIFIG
jgi:hypothetical protein